MTSDFLHSVLHVYNYIYVVTVDQSSILIIIYLVNLLGDSSIPLGGRSSMSESLSGNVRSTKISAYDLHN